MIIEIKKDFEGHTIQNLARTAAPMEHVFSWKFVNAGFFLVAVMAGIEEMDLETDIIPVLKDRGQELMTTKWVEERNLQLFLVKEQEFMANRGRYSISRQKVKNQTPYQVAVYCCEMEGNAFAVYQAREKENRTAVPVAVMGAIRYKTPLFSNRTTGCLRIDKIPGYVDGMIACKPSFSRHAFPIAGNCLGKELAVLMPKGESLSLLVTEKYRQFYMIKVEEG